MPRYTDSQRKAMFARINKLNKSAMIPITNKSFASHLMAERLNEEKLNDPFWKNLSTDKSSGKLFETPRADPTLPVVFVDIDFAKRHAGNKLRESSDKLIDIVKSGKTFDSVPIYDLKSHKIEEGNHRVDALKRMGYKSVPVDVQGGWD